jgi:tetratricopeptide (TPR) repeat protein
MEEQEEQYKKAELLFNGGNAEEAIAVLNEMLLNDNLNPECLMLRAKIFYQQQKWGNALNDLNQILETDPGHQMAQSYKSMVMNIISFWNKDSFNP